MIRWVAFDAVGTLIEPQPSAIDVYWDVATDFGAALDRETIARRFRAAFAREFPSATDEAGFATDEATERARWRRVVDAVLLEVANRDEGFEQLWAHFSRPEAWHCYEDVGSTLMAVQTAGYQVAIASNFDQRLHMVCDGLADLQPISARVISSEVGARKPGRRFFEAMLARLNCSRQEVILVGDDWENDCRGASAYGIRSVWLQRGVRRDVPVSLRETVLTVSSLNDLSEQLAWLAK